MRTLLILLLITACSGPELDTREERQDSFEEERQEDGYHTHEGMEGDSLFEEIDSST